MFKIIVLSAGFALAHLGAASAGGYTVPVIEAPVVVPEVTPVPAFNWQGVYAGGAIGYSFNGDDRVGITPPDNGTVYTPGSVDISGMSWSLYLGYRWQREAQGRQIVFGPELAYEGGNASDSFDSNGVSASSELDRLLSLRWKTGLLNEAQDTLFYGTIGYAHGKFDYSVDGAGMDYRGDFTDNAWTVGLGIEKKLNERVSLFGEWEFRQFGKTVLSDAAGYTTRATPEHHNIRIGVNISF
ncbi:outer membrane protein [Paracoccus sp. (in: a-proteobacteria)]|uniref:outer membrane protein n=1 Tax=Paracoccus sp. TaxID=267 RepID=UPI0028B0CBA4|nr:outer membrane beta-barrel protein [Paracoccus sp. (in: a-proteobacteria)]